MGAAILGHGLQHLLTFSTSLSALGRLATKTPSPLSLISRNCSRRSTSTKIAYDTEPRHSEGSQYRNRYASDSKDTIINAFLEKINNNVIKKDDHQFKIVQSLQRLSNELRNYTPPEDSIWSRLGIKDRTSERPRGLYLWGSVGCGKTFLMDLFYDNCSVSDDNKRRVHFHRFMLDVHAEIHQIKLGKIKNRFVDQKNPIPTVAKLIASRTWLICLDEFQVTDVADAMILKQLFTNLFQDGVILLATSNRPPDDLYKSGLQRSAFLPFIPILKDNCQVECLDSNIDYRRQHSKIKKVYFVTKGSESGDSNLDTLFKVLSLAEDDIVGPKIFMVNNRQVRLNKTCGGIADCEFSELCQQPLGADDYDRMGKLFHTVIIRNIPQMTVKMKSDVRRFITFIDMMYDNRVRVVFSARVPVDELFNFDTSGEFDGGDEESRVMIDELGLKGNEGKSLSFVTGEDEIFAFSRTISRISEMQTNQYWESIASPDVDSPSLG